MSHHLALVLRGISYYDDMTRKVCNSHTVDYKECLESFQTNLVEPLKVIFNQIDTFIVTYNSSKISQVLADYDPKDTYIYPADAVYHQDPKEVTARLLSDSIDMVENYSKLFHRAYDNVMIIRFDMYFPIKFPIERIKFDRVNFGWRGTYGQCDDCFHFFSMRHIPRIREYIPHHNKDGYMHGLNHAFELESNYLCFRPPSDLECYPDFYFFQRRLEDYKTKKMQLVEYQPEQWSWMIEPSQNIQNYSTIKHIVILTSCINTENAPLSYSKIRSVFTPEERMKQTLESIQSIRTYIPNAVIVLMNNNFLTADQHVTFLVQCDYVFIFDSISVKGIVFTADLGRTFPNKNCTETASLLYALQRIKELKLEFDYIWKLSGRYKMFSGFDVKKWLNQRITVPPRQPNGSINNILYSIPKSCLDYYTNRLKKCFLECYDDPDGEKGNMVEHNLFEPSEVMFLFQTARIGGMCSHLEDRRVLYF